MKKVFLSMAIVTGVTISSCASASGSSGNYLLTAIQTYNSLDTNGDGKLSRSEVSGQLLENFTSIDTNNDSGLTLTELLALKSTLGI
ncbi:MAG: hypothetical protein ACK5IC_11040 [Moheibacter sp.]